MSQVTRITLLRCSLAVFVFVIVFVFVFVFVSVFILVRSSLLITLFKCLKGHKAQGSLCMSKSKSSLSVVSEVVTGVGIELSQTRSGQLNTEYKYSIDTQA